MKYKFVIFLMFQLFAYAGCANSDDTTMNENTKSISGTNPNNYFRGHFADAGKFLELKHKGDQYREQGNYEKALAAYSQALDSHAYSRPEQAIALDHIAMTYEQIGDLKNAADNYELASEATMNENRRVSLMQKAQVLRKNHTEPRLKGTGNVDN